MIAADELGSPEVSVLIRMLDGEPMNMRRFSAGCRSSPARARTALARLTEMRLVEVEQLGEGAVKISQIDLTKLGREVAGHLASANRALERGKPKRG